MEKVVTIDMALHERIGPAITQAFLLARYQALRRIGKEIVEVNEGDVISQKPSSEEERIMAFNVSVVSTLEDIFSWMNKDRTSRTSRLSFVESWRFHRAVYRAWIMSTLYGYESAPRGQLQEGPSAETERDFLSKFTSQELTQLDAVCRFLRYLASLVILAEGRLVGSLEVYDFGSLYLFAGPHIVLRCFEEQSSSPLPMCYILDDVYEGYLFPSLKGILSQRNVTSPLGFVAILDDMSGIDDICRGCGRDGRGGLSPTQLTGRLFNENNWMLLKAELGIASEVFLKLAYNEVEDPLFKVLREANYDTFVGELFIHKDAPYQDWTRQDWVCSDCFRDFYIQTVFRWWRARKERAGQQVPENCRHGYYCKDQCFERGLDHARRFNHACMPVDLGATLTHFHSR